MPREDYILVDDLDKILKQVAEVAKQSVLVGIPEGSEREDGGISNAALAYIHEFGSPAANIPARPFMREGIEEARERITAQLEKGSKALLDGDPHKADQALNAAGLIAVNSIKGKITDGDFAPLAEATIRRKGSDRPLIDTGAMRNSITYLVVNGEGSD
jgi:hypothetical protein